MHYIIFDTALNGVYSLLALHQKYPAGITLFKGTNDESMVDVLPFIFPVDENFAEFVANDPELSLKEILHVESDQPIRLLQEHFKEFVYQKVNGRTCFFRCWDPRVLKKFLPTCTEQQVRLFFAPIRKLVFQDGEGQSLVYTREQYKLHADRVRTADASVYLAALEIKDEIPA